MKDHPAPGQPIGAVERDTGIARDTLRVWERRYGFPLPVRDASGERLYPREQVRRLQLIRRLLNRGFRPGQVVPLDEEALRRLGEGEARTVRKGGANPGDPLTPFLDGIRGHDAGVLAALLEERLRGQGLRRLVIDIIAPLAAAVGEAWAAGRMEVFEEHFMTRELGRFLDGRIDALEPAEAAGAPVLLATLPGERHTLGLRMVEALLREGGRATVNLGAELSIDQLRLAAARYRPAALALSFSGNYPYAAIRRNLTELAGALPEGVELWVGGEGVRPLKRAIPGVRVLPSLEAL
jgi:MerR family transcriptional regulator, light-induced transcriptional regulator